MIHVNVKASSLRFQILFFLLAFPVHLLPVHQVLVIVLAEVRNVVVHLIGILQHLLDVLRSVPTLLVVVQTQVHEPDLRVINQVSLEGNRGAAAQGYPVSRILLLHVSAQGHMGKQVDGALEHPNRITVFLGDGESVGLVAAGGIELPLVEAGSGAGVLCHAVLVLADEHHLGRASLLDALPVFILVYEGVGLVDQPLLHVLRDQVFGDPSLAQIPARALSIRVMLPMASSPSLIQ